MEDAPCRRVAVGAAAGRRARRAQLGRGALRLRKAFDLAMLLGSRHGRHQSPARLRADRADHRDHARAEHDVSRGRSRRVACAPGLPRSPALRSGFSPTALAQHLALPPCDNSPLLVRTVRWGGVAYLLWLAWETWLSERDLAVCDRRSRRRALMHSARADHQSAHPRPRCSTSPCCRNSSGPGWLGDGVNAGAERGVCDDRNSPSTPAS